MWGAALLAAKAAYRSGAGYVHVRTDKAVLLLNCRGAYRENRALRSARTYALGPGWGTGEAQKKCLRELARSQVSRAVLDADALNLVAKERWTDLLHKEWILTPHPKELSRLLNMNNGGEDVDAIQADRPAHAKQAVQALKTVVVLKGYRTLVAYDKK